MKEKLLYIKKVIRTKQNDVQDLKSKMESDGFDLVSSYYTPYTLDDEIDIVFEKNDLEYKL